MPKQCGWGIHGLLRAKPGIGRIAQRSCRLALLAATVLSARAADAPYLPLGPHYFASVTAEGPLDYGDILITRPLAVAFEGGATYKGWSISAWHGKDVNSSSDASEAFAAYSHKLPFVDLHVGGVWCSTAGALPECKSSARLEFTSNSLPDTTLGFAFDQSFSSADRIYHASALRRLYRKQNWTVDVKAEGGDWTYNRFSAEGVSFRVLVADRIAHGLSTNYFWGVLTSRIDRGSSAKFQTVPIAGFTLSWSF